MTADCARRQRLDGSSPAVAVSGLSKRYCRDLGRSLRYGAADIAGELAPWREKAAALRPGEFWALDEVSLELNAGEALAVLGRNGAGKSTLLKILHGLVKPDRGEVRVRGSVGAILSLGTELDPNLTARENAALAAALAGFTPAGRRRLLDEAVAFAELEDFVDAPVRSFSSGMKARLAFGLAAHARPDILLVDEALAVGDFAFQRKCVSHMRAFLKGGGALLFVSHNVRQVQQVCDRGILLDRGREIFSGTAVESLHRMLEQRSPAESAVGQEGAAGPVVIEGVAAEADGGDLRTGQEARFTLRYRSLVQAEIYWGISVWTADQSVCITSAWDDSVRTLPPGSGEMSCLVPGIPLLAGRYVVQAAMLDRATLVPLALFGYDRRGLVIDVRSDPDLFTNLQMMRNQLVKIDAIWR